jgi:hypothetical protein
LLRIVSINTPDRETAVRLRYDRRFILVPNIRNEREEIPMARSIDLDVSAFHHHIETLEELGFLKRVESRRRRGALEHFRGESRDA